MVAKKRMLSVFVSAVFLFPKAEGTTTSDTVGSRGQNLHLDNGQTGNELYKASDGVSIDRQSSSTPSSSKILSKAVLPAGTVEVLPEETRSGNIANKVDKVDEAEEVEYRAGAGAGSNKVQQGEDGCQDGEDQNSDQGAGDTDAGITGLVDEPGR